MGWTRIYWRSLLTKWNNTARILIILVTYNDSPRQPMCKHYLPNITKNNNDIIHMISTSIITHYFIPRCKNKTNTPTHHWNLYIIHHTSKIDILQCKSNILMLASPTKWRYIYMSTTNAQYTNFRTSTSTERIPGTNYYFYATTE
jgi:hypothetical protein